MSLQRPRRTKKTINRDRQWGRIYSCAGGGPNQPTVALACSGLWTAEGEEDYGYNWLQPQVLSAEKAFFAAKGHDALAEWIAQDRAAWLKEVSSRKSLPVCVMLDTSQSPSSISSLDRVRDAQTIIEGVRLTAGADDPLLARRSVANANQTSIGAKWLVSWFDGRVAQSMPDELKHNQPYSPDKIVMHFKSFVDEEAPGMNKEDLRSSLSAAERLVKRAEAQSDTEALMSLSADETTAAVVMLALLASEMCSPPVGYQPGDTYGFDPTAPRGSFNFPNLG